MSSWAEGVVYAPNGDLYASITGLNQVLKFPAGGGASVVIAGTGTAGSSGDGGPATSATLRGPTHLARDVIDGTLYISDAGNNAVRRVDGATGVITTLAGTGTSGFSGDNGAATSAQLASPSGLAYRGGYLYIADSGNDRLRRVDLGSGVITTIAGTALDAARLDGNGTAATLDQPSGLAWGPNNTLAIADTRHHAIRSYNVTTTAVNTIVGTGTATTDFAVDGGDGGQGSAATLKRPVAVAYDSADGLIIADSSNYRMRRVGADGVITTIGSNGASSGAQATSGAATAGNIGSMSAITVGPGDLIAYASNGFAVRLLGTRPTVTSNTPAAPTAGTPYTHTFTATAIADRDTTWSVPAGALPAGLSLSSAGVLSGTATASGSFNATIRAANGFGAPVDTPITLNVASSAPGAPTAVTATAGDASAVVSWTAPASTGGSPITRYYLNADDGNGNNITKQCLPNESTGCAFAGLTNGTTYTFKVIAVTSLGSSGFSAASGPVTPVAAPSGAGSGSSGSGGATPASGQQVATTAPRSIALGSRTFALNASATGTGGGSSSGSSTVSGGKLTYSAATPSICTVDPAGVVTALKAGTCTVTITAAATTTSASTTKNVDVTIAAPEASVAALPAGPQRFAGANRVATSADIAANVFPTPAAGTSYDVVIATAGSFADALAGTRLAGQVGGPLLLTNGTTLSPEAAEQVKRLVAAGGTVYVLGGDAAVSDAVPKATGDLITGDSVVRVGGANRYETAAMVADATTKRAGDVGPIYLVTGQDFADGVSVGAYAQSTGGVVLLTDGEKMPAATAKYLADHDPQGTRAVAIGGPARAAATSTGLSGAAERAVVGADRFETSAKLAAAITGSTPASGAVASVGLAGGTSWPDALSGSAAMAALGGPLLLTQTGSEAVPSSTAAALSGLDAKRVLVFGGTSVVPTKAYDKAGSLLDI